MIEKDGEVRAQHTPCRCGEKSTSIVGQEPCCATCACGNEKEAQLSNCPCGCSHADKPKAVEENKPDASR